MKEIDMIEYGVLRQKVSDIDKKVDKMERQLDELIALANKGRGGLWFGMMVVSALSALGGYIINIIKTHA